jgi:molybdopterin-guanine dinucleotide biosynthesis protein A
MNIVCVVLAGGEGRRMGGAKPLQRFGDSALIERAVVLARGYADDVAVAVRDPAQVAGVAEAPTILDDPAIAGPLGGVAAALAHARDAGAQAVLTLPCDTPFLPNDLAARLVAALEGAPGAAAAVAESGGQAHPVCALWRVSARETLAAYASSGRRSLMGFAEACAAVAVAWDAGPPDPFAGANTPDELAALQPRGATRPPG